MSHEAIEEGEAVEETEIEEEEEYDIDSDSNQPIYMVDNDEDAFDSLMFLRAVTTRKGRMGRVVYRE